jgi:hypothetical protein
MDQVKERSQVNQRMIIPGVKHLSGVLRLDGLLHQQKYLQEARLAGVVRAE